MGTGRGVIIKQDGNVFTYTDSAQVEAAVRGVLIVIEQNERRRQKLELLLHKTRMAYDEMLAKEAAGKARRPARKG